MSHVEWGLADDMRNACRRVVAWVRANLLIWFDPDHDWRSIDKIEHAFGGFACALLLLLVVHTALGIFAWTLALGFVYELGQADVAHSQRLLGKPGFGIGLVDLAYDGFGALVLLAFRFTLRML